MVRSYWFRSGLPLSPFVEGEVKWRIPRKFISLYVVPLVYHLFTLFLLLLLVVSFGNRRRTMPRHSYHSSTASERAAGDPSVRLAIGTQALRTNVYIIMKEDSQRTDVHLSLFIKQTKPLFIAHLSSYENFSGSGPNGGRQPTATEDGVGQQQHQRVTLAWWRPKKKGN